MASIRVRTSQASSLNTSLRRITPLCTFRFTISTHYRKAVEKQLKTAQQVGKLCQVKYPLAILAVMDGQPFEQVARNLRVHRKTVTEWVRLFCCYGVKGAPHKKPTGRKAKLTSSQKEELARLLDEGPVKAGFTGAGWR